MRPAVSSAPPPPLRAVPPSWIPPPLSPFIALSLTLPPSPSSDLFYLQSLFGTRPSSLTPVGHYFTCSINSRSFSRIVPYSATHGNREESRRAGQSRNRDEKRGVDEFLISIFHMALCFESQHAS